ncbi:MAG TPA: DUF4388 domain-containing protein [Thermoanaerobaculia bacterium]|nr:DUF4388 domain-containing protein [Thermoanaerobaculia bacterium]
MSPASTEHAPRTGISGSLEDVSVADVMQFIHLGRRTGTLMLRRDDATAMIGFHAGKLVSARAPEQPKLGDLLVNEGLVERATLEDALADETIGEGRRSLGQILLAEGFVSAEQLREVVVHQIEGTISEVVRWDHGSFEFALDDLRPVDDIALYPGELVPDADLNTQMVLLEAARIFDEQRGDREVGEDTEPAGLAPGEVTWPGAGLAGLDLEEKEIEIPGAGSADAPELQVVTNDEEMVAELGRDARDLVTMVRRCSLARAGSQVSSQPAPVVVLDLRDDELGPQDVTNLRRARPRASVVAMVEEGPMIAHAYRAGAVAVLPAGAHAVVACVENILRSRRELAEPANSRRGGSGVARLRRVFGDLRSGLLSATVALNLMHIISESVERAVLLLVRSDQLVALGAFGSGQDDRPLAELTRGLRLSLSEDNALTGALDDAEARTWDFDEADLPERLVKLLGRPANDQLVVFPVLGSQRVIAVIYTDNGGLEEPIEDVEILELATAQVGMAFENELLRRKIGDS